VTYGWLAGWLASAGWLAGWLAGQASAGWLAGWVIATIVTIDTLFKSALSAPLHHAPCYLYLFENQNIFV
jgi:hypothetical protein